jgi:hypothetical protein
MIYLLREADGSFTERLRQPATPPHFLGFTLGDGLAQIVMDPAQILDSGPEQNVAYVLNSLGTVRVGKLLFNSGLGVFAHTHLREYSDDSVLPGSHFSNLQNPSRAALSNRVLVVLAEGAATFIHTQHHHTDPASKLAVLPASPTTLIAGAEDVVVGDALAAVAATGSDAVQFFGIDRTAAINISVKGAAVEGQNGFTRLENVNRLAYNDANLIAASSTTENAITLINVDDLGSPQPVAVIEGAANRMLFPNATTLVVQRSSHISVLDVSSPGAPVEKMRLTPQNTPGLLSGSYSGMAMAGPGLLALGGLNEVVFVQIDQPPATQSLAVSGWLALGGVERAYAPLHVQGSVLVKDAEQIRLESQRLQSTATNFAVGNGASVATEGVAIGMGAEAAYLASALGMGAKALGRQSVALGGGFALGDSSIAIGHGVYAKSFMETAMGANSTFPEPLSATSWNPLDRLFVIGNGNGGFSDALVMLKNGNTTLNGNLTVNGGIHLTGPVTGGTTWPAEVAQISAANVFTQDVSTQGHYKYATPKTGKVRVHARAFAPASWFTSRNVDYAFDNAFLYLEDNPNGTARFNAGVDLPAGAVVTKLSLHYMDAQGQGTNGDDDFNAHLSLRYFDHVSGNEGSVTGITLLTTGIDGDIKTEEAALSPPYHTVTENRAYGLRFQMTNCAGNDLRFYGVTIEYQTTTVQP